MTISFSTSGVSFGSVYVGAFATQTVTVSNSDTASTAIVIGPTAAGFSMSASSLTVPAATSTGGVVTNGSLTLTLTFAPPSSQSAAWQSYGDHVTCAPNGGSAVLCSLSGTGLTGLTVSPANVEFGAVPTNSTVTQTIQVTNSGTLDVTLTPPSGYSLQPASIPADGSPHSVTVTFAPTAQGLYAGSLTTSGNVVCNVSGTGVSISPEVAGGDPNQFETEGQPASGSAGTKYYQVAVPSFALDGDGSNGGNSFVRLGSFPAVSNWTSTPTGDSTSPSGFQKSLDLASLVGNPALITAVEGVGPNIDSVPSGFQDGRGLPAPYDGASDPDYLLGFADDTRLRGTPDDGTMNVNTMAPQTIVAGQTVANTPANRQQETLSLLTKGGWWDHSDGNRVTTTAGDKIEVIQGNYKLVVLGRQALPAARTSSSDSNYSNLVDNAFITDVSGGHFQEQYPSPTPCIKTIEYSVDSTTNEWTLYQDNSIGNLITKLRGRTVDLFQGSSRETYVGSDPTLPTLPNTSEGWIPDATLDPVITSKTWAQRIMTYVGSAQKPVPELFTLTFADAIQDIKFVTADVLSSTQATTVMNVTTAGVVGNVYVAPLTMEITTGFKLSVQPQVLGVNLNKTRIIGDSTTVNSLGTVATVTETQMASLRTDITSAQQGIVATNARITGVDTRVTQEATRLSTLTTDCTDAFTVLSAAVNL